MTYKIEFTELAKAFAIAKGGGLEAVEAHAREEIDSFIPEGETLNGVTSFEIGGQLFVAECNAGDTVQIDTATYEEGPELKAGPFKGRRVMMPRGDSEDR